MQFIEIWMWRGISCTLLKVRFIFFPSSPVSFYDNVYIPKEHLVQRDK